MTRGVESIARGEASRISDTQRVVVRNELEWRALWAAHAGPESAAPAVDFDRRIVAGVFLGTRPSDGSGISIIGYRQADAALDVLVEENPPGKQVSERTYAGTGGPTKARPYHIVSLPRFDGNVRFVDAQAGVAPAGRAARATEDTWSSTGLDPQMAGALAYLAGPFSGALLLTIERTSQFVRFHAWQALIALGLLGLLAVGCLALAFFLLLFSPTAFRAMLWIAAVLGATWLAVWAACLWQAYRGQRWKLPIAGAYADRLAR